MYWRGLPETHFFATLHAMEPLTPLKFSLLSSCSEVSHGVFLRHGGVSKAPFEGLNVGTSVGDLPENVLENRERIRRFLGVPRIVYLAQEHGVKIVQAGRGEGGGWQCLGRGDGLITREQNVGLAILHADCQAAIFYDVKNRALGLAHAGWKGSVQNIYAEMVEAMRQAFHTEPKDLRVCISPSLGPEKAEYIDYRQDFPESLWRFQERENHFDFWKMSRAQLEALGVTQIECANLCTHASSDCFSYRRDRITGRHATVAFLR